MESASESRNSSSESRSSENVIDAKPRRNASRKKRKYNSLDDIDMLIERLEASMQKENSSSDKVRELLTERREKVEKLRQLVEAKRQAQAEERLLRQIAEENREIDDAIAILTKDLRLK